MLKRNKTKRIEPEKKKNEGRERERKEEEKTRRRRTTITRKSSFDRMGGRERTFETRRERKTRKLAERKKRNEYVMANGGQMIQSSLLPCLMQELEQREEREKTSDEY